MMGEGLTLTHRGFLKSGGALVVSFGITAALPARSLAQGPPGAPAVAADLDSFLAVHADGSCTIFTSHVDVGTGLATAYRQIAAEELGMPVERFTVVEGDTAATPDHGGTGGSSGVPRGGADIRRAAATARQAWLALAATQLNRPASELAIVDGVIGAPKSDQAASGRPVTVASLIGGKKFAIKVDPNAPLKSPAAYTTVGKLTRVTR